VHLREELEEVALEHAAALVTDVVLHEVSLLTDARRRFQLVRPFADTPVLRANELERHGKPQKSV
jgi:hypothetical protein